MLKGFFRRVITQTEENASPFGQYILLFFSILAVRLSLEFFSSRKLFTFYDVLHIGLWFSCIVMAFMIMLKLFSGEKMVKAARVVITFFTIALTAPILDLMISGGKGMKMSYLALENWQDILYSYVTVGGASLSRGATLGIRIEILILIWASYNYFRTKGRSIAWSAFGSWVIYTALFLSGAVPLFLQALTGITGLSYAPEGHFTSEFLYLLCFSMLCIALFLHHPQNFIHRFKTLPWAAITGAIGAMWLGYLLYTEAYEFRGITYVDDLSHLILAALTVLQISVLTTLKGRNFGIMLTWTAATALLAGFHFFFAAALGFGAWFIRNHEPLRLGGSPLLGLAFPSLLANYAAFSGFMLFGGPMIGFPPLWILTFALGGLSYALYAETETLRPDSSLQFLDDFLKRNSFFIRLLAEITFAGALTCLYFIFPDQNLLSLSLITLLILRLTLLFTNRMNGLLGLWFSTFAIILSLIFA